MDNKISYVPPALRHLINHKTLNLKYKQKVVLVEVKTKEQLLNEYSKENYGKADTVWEED